MRRISRFSFRALGLLMTLKRVLSHSSGNTCTPVSMQRLLPNCVQRMCTETIPAWCFAESVKEILFIIDVILVYMQFSKNCVNVKEFTYVCRNNVERCYFSVYEAARRETCCFFF